MRCERDTHHRMVSESKAALRQAESMKESWNFGLRSGIERILRGRVRGGGSDVALKVIRRLWGGLSGYHKCRVRTSTSPLPSREHELCVVLFDTQGVKVMTLTGITGNGSI